MRFMDAHLIQHVPIILAATHVIANKDLVVMVSLVLVSDTDQILEN